MYKYVNKQALLFSFKGKFHRMFTKKTAEQNAPHGLVIIQMSIAAMSCTLSRRTAT